MAKDPAMLWYWNDWHSGTVLFSRFLKGCYIDLLHAQFNNGPLSLEEIKTCLGSDFGQSWPTIQKKFKQTEQGLFFNEKLEREKQKRIKFTESRKRNREGKTYDDTYDKHMRPHMENENRNENKDFKEGGVGEGFFVNELSMETNLTKIEIINVQEFISVTCAGKKLTEEEVVEQWKAFKIDNFKKREWYGDREKLISHFRRALKNQLKNAVNGKYNASGAKPGTSEARVAALKNWGIGRKVSEGG